MVMKAIRKNPLFEISMSEINRQGPTFTIDTVKEFLATNPEEEFLLLLGSDAFNGLESWKSHEELLQLVDIVVAIRPGESLENIPGAHVKKIESTMFDISSTNIRHAAKSGADLTPFVPEEIFEEVQRIYGAKS